MYFGDAPEGGYQITSISTSCIRVMPATRTFSSFSQALTELIEARIWAGLHFRTPDVQGQALGRNVAEYAVANYFTPPSATAPPATPPTAGPPTQLPRTPTQLPRTGTPPLAPLLTIALGLTAAGLLLRRPRR